MGDVHHILDAIQPVVLLLLLGVGVAVLSRALSLSPIVGYLALGLGLQASGFGMLFDRSSVAVLAELGVVLLLFDIGLHFSLSRIREQASDIFGFGAVQVLFGTLGIAGLAMIAGVAALPALLVGATLALSSTAVVARLIAERHQQNCPVGLTATAILIFQDVAAILLLIVVNALGRDGVQILPELGAALAKAALAFCIAVLLARLIVRPLFDLIAQTNNEEVFTGTALLVALAAGWVTGSIGLSLTLGAFLGGMIIAETPYRPIVQSEIKPFRGLLLGFFFISVGLSLDLPTLARMWPAVIGVAVALIAAKVVLNACASLIFRWSVPGSTQLGFLLAQGSEFAFVVLGLPAARALIGESTSSVLIAAVALSLAATPTLAEVGRTLAGRMRRRPPAEDPELQKREVAAPVFIVGMGTVGRTVADALVAFGIGYDAIERDQRRLAEASADGYAVAFGDTGDPRIWEPVSMHGRRIGVITAPSFEVSSGLTPMANRNYPELQRVVAVTDDSDGERYRALGMIPVVDRAHPRGLELAGAVLAALGVDSGSINEWMKRQQERAVGSAAATRHAA